MTATTGNKDYDAGWALRWMTAPGKATRITTTRMADNSRQKGGVSGSAENRAGNGGGRGSRSGGSGNGEGRQQSTKSAKKMAAAAIEVGKRQQARGERQRRRRGRRWG